MFFTRTIRNIRILSLVALGSGTATVSHGQTAADSLPSAAPVTVAPIDSTRNPATSGGTWTGQSDPRAGLSAAGPTSLLRGGPLGELMTVYWPHHPADIQRHLDETMTQQRLVQSELDQGRSIATDADGQVRIMNDELRTTKTRLDVAKKQKNETDRVALTANSKQQEREKNYLERLRDAIHADAERLGSDHDAFAARAKALQLESDVARKHEQLGAAGAKPGPSDIASYEYLLKQMLTAQRVAADKEIDASSRHREVAIRRLKQLEALSKLGR